MAKHLLYTGILVDKNGRVPSMKVTSPKPISELSREEERDLIAEYARTDSRYQEILDHEVEPEFGSDGSVTNAAEFLQSSYLCLFPLPNEEQQ